MIRLAVAFALTLFPEPAAERIPPDVREHVTRRVDEGYCVGMIVGVVDLKGTTYFPRGRQSATQGPSINENTIFEIGSITKAFTGIMLADLVERKKAAFEDPVDKFLPPGVTAPSRGGKKITLIDLATHRSGLPRLPDNMDSKDPSDPYADYTAERLYAFLKSHQLGRNIGARYEYSNLGMGLLGHVLARTAGKTYEQLVVQTLCEPVGMKDTRITLTTEQNSRLAVGHDGGKPVANWHLDALAGAGALRSTARDMLRFMAANLQFSESPLSGAMKLAHRDRVATESPDVFIALGWHVLTKHGTTIIWHNGGTAGYHSFCGFAPEKGVGVVVLANSSEDIDDIGLHILEPHYELKKLRKSAVLSSEALDSLAGYYELRPDVIVHITRDGEQLFAQVTGQAKLPIFPESESRFYYKAVDAQLTFTRGAGGKVGELILHQGGVDQTAKKLGPDYRPPERVEVPVDAAKLAAYPGQYELAPGMVFDVVVEEGQLKVKLTNQPRFPVYAESETKFFYKVVDAQLTFVKDETGKVMSLILHQGGVEQTAKKTK